jgi:hypothetical protein
MWGRFDLQQYNQHMWNATNNYTHKSAEIAEYYVSSSASENSETLEFADNFESFEISI